MADKNRRASPPFDQLWRPISLWFYHSIFIFIFLFIFESMVFPFWDVCEIWLRLREFRCGVLCRRRSTTNRFHSRRLVSRGFPIGLASDRLWFCGMGLRRRVRGWWLLTGRSMAWVRVNARLSFILPWAMAMLGTRVLLRFWCLLI